jgi:hypothetical protein
MIKENLDIIYEAIFLYSFISLGIDIYITCNILVMSAMVDIMFMGYYYLLVSIQTCYLKYNKIKQLSSIFLLSCLTTTFYVTACIINLIHESQLHEAPYMVLIIGNITYRLLILIILFYIICKKLDRTDEPLIGILNNR